MSEDCLTLVIFNSLLISTIAVGRGDYVSSDVPSTCRLFCSARFVKLQGEAVTEWTDLGNLEAFEDFLQNYKSTVTDLEALEDLNLEDLNHDGRDDTSDEYDMMDDVAGGKEARHANKFKAPKRKYMEMLQEVADRKINEICIELDDVEYVSMPLQHSLVGS